jgi:putative PEP-CTERM system TPR-repeat lipoprotein
MNVTKSQRRLSYLATVALVGITAFAASAAIPATGPYPTDPSVAHLVSEAQKAIQAGNIPLAVINLKNASSAAPRNAAVRTQLGEVLAQSGDYYSAERELRQARKDGASDQTVLPSLFQVMLFRHEEKALLEEFPDPPPNANSAAAADVFKAHALAMQNLGQTAAAAAAMDKSLQLRRDASGLLARARISQLQQDIPGAMGFVDQATKLSPADPGPMLFKFGLLMADNKLDAALGLSNDLIARFPTNLPAHVARVEVLMRMNQLAKANSEVDAILAKTPGTAVGVYYRALLMAKAGNIKGAWNNAQTLPPQFIQSQPGTALNVSEMADRAGATETAAAILSSAVAAFPSDASLRLRLAAIRIRQQDSVGALNALEPIKNSLDPATTQLLAQIYLKAGKPDDALSSLQGLDQAGKGSDAVTLDIVGIEKGQGQSDEALKSLTQAVARKPNDPALVSQLVMALASAGRFADALSAADKLGSDPKQQVPSLTLRAQVQIAQQNLDGALASYNRAVQLEPRNAVSLYGRASVLTMMEKYADANKDLNIILAGDPKNIAAYLKLAEVAAHQGQDQAVRSFLSKASQQVPGDAAPRVALIRYLSARKDMKGALAAANDLVRMQPKNLQALALLGQTQGAAGQKSEAVQTFKKVVSLAPKGPAPQILLGNALEAAGDRAGALAAVKAAVASDSNSADVLTALINLQFDQGDAEGAVATARNFRSANPSNTADVILGDTLVKAKHADQATAVYQQSFAAKPNGTVLMRIVRLNLAAGDTNSALEALSKWLASNPTDSAVRTEYATLLMGQGSNVKAASQYQLILQREPNNVLSLNNLGWLKQKDDPKQAISLVSQAAKLAPDSPEVLDTLGWLTFQQKHAADSVPILKRAHDLRPTNGSVTYHLAVAMDGAGEHDAARGLLKSLLASNTNFAEKDAASQLAAKWH